MVEATMKALSIIQNINQQEFVIREKVAAKIGIKDSQKAKAVVTAEIAKTEKRNQELLINGIKPLINTKATLSRQGVASRFNRKSKSTGSRIIKKLVSLDLLTDTPDYISIKPSTQFEVRQLRTELQQYNLVLHKGWLKVRLCNTIKSGKGILVSAEI